MVCVVESDGRLVGTLSPAALLGLPAEASLGDVCHRQVPRVPLNTDQEHLATLALAHGAAALPLVDEHGRLAGVVGPLALMDVLRREHVEDLHRLAGVMRETKRARHALEDPPLRRARHRLPWLLLGLLGSALATWLMTGFETTLALVPAVAFFVPGVVYLADAVGITIRCDFPHDIFCALCRHRNPGRLDRLVVALGPGTPGPGSSLRRRPLGHHHSGPGESADLPGLRRAVGLVKRWRGGAQAE